MTVAASHPAPVVVGDGAGWAFMVEEVKRATLVAVASTNYGRDAAGDSGEGAPCRVPANPRRPRASRTHESLRLPFAPLALAAGPDDPRPRLRVFGSAVLRAWDRGRETGHLSVNTADVLAVRFLRRHPMSIWGDLWLVPYLAPHATSESPCRG